MLSLILTVAAGLSLAMAIAWIVQRLSGNVGWVDVVWAFSTGSAGCIAATMPIGSDAAPPTMRRLLIAVLVAIWALRLAFHLAVRVAGTAEDGRYRMLRERWAPSFQSRLFWFLQVQAVASTLLVLSILLAAHNPSALWRASDVVGVLLLVVAVIGEGAADRQLARFKATRDGAASAAGSVCDVGLWAWSRHPNYFFEWLAWLAYPLFAVDLGGAFPWGWLALLGPILMYALLVHGSGIPPLEQHMLRTRPVAYRRYQQRTSAFVPWPPRSVSIEDGGTKGAT